MGKKQQGSPYHLSQWLGSLWFLSLQLWTLLPWMFWSPKRAHSWQGTQQRSHCTLVYHCHPCTLNSLCPRIGRWGERSLYCQGLLTLMIGRMEGHIGLSAVVQSLSRIWLFATPWTAARQASLSCFVCQNVLKLMSIELMMPSKHLILCLPFLLQPSSFPSIKVFPSELVLHIRWPKDGCFSFSISPSNEYSGLISFRTG